MDEYEMRDVVLGLVFRTLKARIELGPRTVVSSMQKWVLVGVLLLCLTPEIRQQLYEEGYIIDDDE